LTSAVIHLLAALCLREMANCFFRIRRSWRGEIYNDSLGRGPALSAYRYAPLATLETANTSPAEIGVVDIAVTRDTIYLHLYRMGGSGDGWLAQLPRHPAKRDKDGELDVLYLTKDRLPLYKDTLQGLKILRTKFSWLRSVRLP